jgi:hypothetical protein
LLKRTMLTHPALARAALYFLGLTNGGAVFRPVCRMITGSSDLGWPGAVSGVLGGQAADGGCVRGPFYCVIVARLLKRLLLIIWIWAARQSPIPSIAVRWLAGIFLLEEEFRRRPAGSGLAPPAPAGPTRP